MSAPSLLVISLFCYNVRRLHRPTHRTARGRYRRRAGRWRPGAAAAPAWAARGRNRRRCRGWNGGSGGNFGTGAEAARGPECRAVAVTGLARRARTSGGNGGQKVTAPPGGARPESAAVRCRHRAGRRAAGIGVSAAAVTAPRRTRRAAGVSDRCGGGGDGRPRHGARRRAVRGRKRRRWARGDVRRALRVRWLFRERATLGDLNKTKAAAISGTPRCVSRA